MGLYYLSIITDTAFKQQRLPAWQPILTARSVMPIFFGIAAAFVPIGLGLLYLTNVVRHLKIYIVLIVNYCLNLIYFKVQEFTLDYTDCPSLSDPLKSCADEISSFNNVTCNCKITFNLEEDFAVR